MLKHLVFVVLVCWMQSDEAAGETDTMLQFPLSANQVVCNNSNSVQEDVKPSVVMNGHNNYQAAQQIFYIYGPGQLRNSPPNLPKVPEDGKNHSKIRDDYILTPGIGAHKLHTAQNNWNTARKYCIQEGAHLAIINSDSEEKVLLKLLAQRKLSGAWVGIHDLFKEGDWATVLDESLESTGFAKWTTKWANQPDNAGGNQNCGLLVDQGGFDDGPCSMSLPFICKIHIAASTHLIPEAN